MSQLNARHQALLEYVRTHEGQTAKEIAAFFLEHAVDALQATENATRCALRRLCDKGLLEYRTTKTDRQFPKYYVCPGA